MGGGRASRSAGGAAAALAVLAAGCGAPSFTLSPGRIALVAAFAVLAGSLALGLRGGGSRKDPAAKPGEAGAGWFVLTALAGVAALVIGTCNTFTVPPLRPAPPAPAPPPAPVASPACDDALRAADRAFATLAEAQTAARAAAVTADRACRVEAAAPEPTPPPAPDAPPAADAQPAP